MARYLSEPEEIRTWVEARGGHPIMMETPDPAIGTRSLLQLSFGQHALNADHNEGPDRPVPGFELVAWDDWLRAFREQDLVLVVDEDVSEGARADYRLMSREEAEG